MTSTVTISADFVRLVDEADIPVAYKGVEYDVWCNSNGTVVALLGNGLVLRLKLDQFEVVCYHDDGETISKPQ